MTGLSSKLVESGARQRYERYPNMELSGHDVPFDDLSDQTREGLEMEARLSLLNFLTTLRDGGPSEAMLHAALTATRPRHPSIGDLIEIEWREMLIALIAEVSQ